MAGGSRIGRAARLAWRIVLAVAMLHCGSAMSSIALVGSASASDGDGGAVALVFWCTGAPSCQGTYVLVDENATKCTNPQVKSGPMSLALSSDLSAPGPFQGSMTLVGGHVDHTRNADGSCTFGAASNDTATVSGTWSGAAAAITITHTDSDGTVSLPGALVLDTTQASSAQVTGTFGTTGIQGDGSVQASFSCVGSPICSGTYAATLHDSECSNSFPISGTIEFTGFNLGAGAPLAGTVVLQNANTHDIQNADGSCTLRSTSDTVATYSGTFNGSSGTLTISVNDSGGTVTVPGTFSASGVAGPPPSAGSPPLGLTVNANVTPTSATATAQIQPPAQDVGKTVNVYVFAFAPRSLVKSSRAAVKDDAGGCVLAQLDPSGQLHAVDPSSLTAALTATLTAQGLLVTIVNGVSTPVVAGATFFVGYGPNSGAMIGNGVNAGAVQIPGAQQCPSIYPKTPGPLSGLWYNAQESGWGVHFTQRENALFAAFYTYDAAGNAKWYVASDCAMPGSSATSGQCSGDLYELTASSLFGVASGGAHNAVSKAGTLQVSFADASHATMNFTVGQVTRSLPIQRQLFRAGTTKPTIDYTDLWYAGEQASGWGMAITQQYDMMFLAWFVYDASGKPVWYVASACSVVASGNGCTGDLYQVSGPPFGPSFDASKIRATAVGSASVTFTDPNNGTLTYTVNGTVSSKPITRQVF